MQSLAEPKTFRRLTLYIAQAVREVEAQFHGLLYGNPLGWRIILPALVSALDAQKPKNKARTHVCVLRFEFDPTADRTTFSAVSPTNRPRSSPSPL